jgi:hypothetical protein
LLVAPTGARAVSLAAARASKPNQTRDNLSENQRQKRGTSAYRRPRFRYVNFPLSRRPSTHPYIVYTSWRSVGLSLSPPLRQRCRSRSQTNFQLNPSGTRRVFPRHLAMSGSIPARLEGRHCERENCFRALRKAAFPQRVRLFNVRSEQAPGFKKKRSLRFRRAQCSCHKTDTQGAAEAPLCQS